MRHAEAGHQRSFDRTQLALPLTNGELPGLMQEPMDEVPSGVVHSRNVEPKDNRRAIDGEQPGTGLVPGPEKVTLGAQ